jgi:hypothetical protein
MAVMSVIDPKEIFRIKLPTPRASTHRSTDAKDDGVGQWR